MPNDECRMTNDGRCDCATDSSFVIRHSSLAPTAFTLLEMIVVVAIIGILFALIVPYAWKSIEVGRAAACTSQLRQIGAGLNLYLAEHEQTLPVLHGGRASLFENTPVLDTVLLPYVREKRIFACPSDSKFARTTGTSYFWNTAINGQRINALDFMKLTEDPSRIPVISDKEGFHPYLDKKVNILYADGHATKDLKFSTDLPAE
jgi:prepilin-type N-terminal cleavage/methylation domain-containing protein/prepilin-type processing-associated H-X9-DG protein